MTLNMAEAGSQLEKMPPGLPSSNPGRPTSQTPHGSRVEESDLDEEEIASLSSLQQKARVVEESPQKRFARFNEKIGEGAFKKVYRAWDTTNGVEVAWNAIAIRSLEGNGGGKRVFQEMKILQTLNHPNIIKFYGSWLNRESQTLVFVTELISSGTLKDFTSTRPVRLCILKKWCKQILKGLEYLHTSEPPIIHRDLKPDNIFINGCSGEIRIGDLGLASWHRDNQRTQSILGTPEYMAPELYDEAYDEQVDIYAFGMCILEIMTGQIPYEECSNAAQVFRKVTAGVPPQSLSRLKHGTPVEQFIRKCIDRPVEGSRRPTASELIADEFLTDHPDDDVRCSTLLVDDPSTPTPTEEVSPRGKTISESLSNLTIPSQEPVPPPNPAMPPSPVADQHPSCEPLSPCTDFASPVSPSGSFDYSLSGSISDAGSDGANAASVTTNSTVEDGNRLTPVSLPPPIVVEASSQASEWSCSAHPSKADMNILDVDLRVTHNGNKIRIAFQFNMVSEDAKDTVLEMKNEGALPQDLPKEEMEAIATQLENLKKKFSALRDSRLKFRQRSISTGSLGSGISAGSTDTGQNSASSWVPDRTTSISERAVNVAQPPSIIRDASSSTQACVGGSHLGRPPLPAKQNSSGSVVSEKERKKQIQEDEIRLLESRILCESIEISSCSSSVDSKASSLRQLQSSTPVFDMRGRRRTLSSLRADNLQGDSYSEPLLSGEESSGLWVQPCNGIHLQRRNTSNCYSSTERDFSQPQCGSGDVQG